MRNQASLREVLDGLLGRLGLARRMQEQRALSLWAAIAGPRAAQSSQALRVRDGIMHVAVRTPAWAQQLTMARMELLRRLAQELGEGIIRELRFQAVGWAEAAPTREPARPVAEGQAPQAECPSGSLPAALERIEEAPWRARVGRTIAALARRGPRSVAPQTQQTDQAHGQAE